MNAQSAIKDIRNFIYLNKFTEADSLIRKMDYDSYYELRKLCSMATNNAVVVESFVSNARNNVIEK